MRPVLFAIIKRLWKGLEVLLNQYRYSGKMKVTLYRLAAENNFVIGSFIILRNRCICINYARCQIFYIVFKRAGFRYHKIDIGLIKSCELVRKYSSSDESDVIPKKSKTGYLQQFTLELRTNDGIKYELDFYDHSFDKLKEMKINFQKAWFWKSMINREILGNDCIPRCKKPLQ